ncbi:MAG TPA: MATE family efflux transporter [Bacteroidota bacterium]|nr:MATE family efflux transporter [Bacteroidota bacterium]
MRRFLPRYVRRRLFEGAPRSVRAKQNIVALFLLRGVSVGINLLLVPMTLSYLNQARYGVWLVLSSIIGWVSLMDIGLGNGLRNEFARAVAVNNRDLARTQISTTYACVAAIIAVLIGAFAIVNPLLHWSAILNTPQAMEEELHRLAAVVFVFFCLRLLFGLISTVLLADQKPAMSNLLEVLASVLALAGVYALTRLGTGSLFWLGFVVSGSTAVVPLGANLLLFSTQYRGLAPSPRFVRPDRARALVLLGAQFFLLQIAATVIYATSNVVITQFYGPAEVVPYNIAFRYYGVALMAFTVILTPFWSAFTDAYTRGDTQWITMTLGKLRVAWVILAAALVVMTLCARAAYAFWVGPAVTVSYQLSLVMAAYVLIVAWSTLFAYFIYGTGKITLQLWVAPLTALAVIPLAIFFATGLGLGSAGVVLAICTVLLPGCFLWPIQARRIIAGTARGIWSR